MGRHLLRQVVDTWMMDSFMAPWRRYVDVKESRGEIVTVGNVKVDAINMFARPFVCDSRVCSPRLRRRGKQSCCADLDASVTPDEMNGVRKHFDLIDRTLRAKDPAWAKQPRSFDECVEEKDFQIQLRKRDKRCVFSWITDEGQLLCGIHTACMENGLDIFKIKPKLCSIFPLVLQDMLDGTYLLSKIDEENGALIGFTSYDELPCLHGEKVFNGGPPTYQDFLGTLSNVFGAKFIGELDAAARSWRAARGFSTPALRPQ